MPPLPHVSMLGAWLPLSLIEKYCTPFFHLWHLWSPPYLYSWCPLGPLPKSEAGARLQVYPRGLLSIVPEAICTKNLGKFVTATLK